MLNQYVIRGVSPIDVTVALRCEADRATRDGFPSVVERQTKLALHLENAVAHLQANLPEGHRVQVDIVVDVVPNVNPVLLPEYRPPVVD